VFFELSSGVSLVEVLCAAGSYQPSFVFIVLDERPPTPRGTVLSFQTYQSPDGTSLEEVTATEMVGEPAVIPEQRALTVLNLWRQTADCGVWARYAIGDGAPKLEAARARFPCPTRPGPPAQSRGGSPPSGWKIVAVR
jgi:hypothetical protein